MTSADPWSGEEDSSSATRQREQSIAVLAVLGTVVALAVVGIVVVLLFAFIRTTGDEGLERVERGSAVSTDDEAAQDSLQATLAAAYWLGAGADFGDGTPAALAGALPDTVQLEFGTDASTGPAVVSVHGDGPVLVAATLSESGICWAARMRSDGGPRLVLGTLPADRCVASEGADAITVSPW